ncbi:MAG: hypothetical protein A2498_01440 [Lentisphaerae bacterium RIFOXYC12_FULL_60_16]|nr:MAG: hypothetical protein A2498_01440 [Lentisphaerae bacterium RIFOXYC12_FULL_60_16]
MKQRLDLLMVERGLAESRTLAQRLIGAGQVYTGDRRLDKAGVSVDAHIPLEVRTGLPFVSRGGQKLAAAWESFHLEVGGKVCVDIGASTGGFTDCLLQRGASRVYAVDVGYGQLHWKLRQDPRVTVMEEVNARYLDASMFPERPTVAVVDVSFISLTLVLPAVIQVLSIPAELVTLIKPQFEAGRDQVGKGGVVRDPVVHRTVVERILAFGRDTLGLECAGTCESPLKGPAGNTEFLAYWRWNGRREGNT